ncbi:uncharacterized protein LOC100203116 isoform X33 [Hydra vulgaris]|uniref:Uncharacterized protein LOC100203116 isoform X33 n=1 Tax=Hydra vulgaris TaxID=6087 RepID=A0ABM4BBY8_HYDVU
MFWKIIVFIFAIDHLSGAPRHHKKFPKDVSGEKRQSLGDWDVHYTEPSQLGAASLVQGPNTEDLLSLQKAMVGYQKINKAYEPAIVLAGAFPHLEGAVPHAQLIKTFHKPIPQEESAVDDEDDDDDDDDDEDDSENKSSRKKRTLKSHPRRSKKRTLSNSEKEKSDKNKELITTSKDNLKGKKLAEHKEVEGDKSLSKTELDNDKNTEKETKFQKETDRLQEKEVSNAKEEVKEREENHHKELADLKGKNAQYEGDKPNTAEKHLNYEGDKSNVVDKKLQYEGDKLNAGEKNMQPEGEKETVGEKEKQHRKEFAKAEESEKIPNKIKQQEEIKQEEVKEEVEKNEKDSGSKFTKQHKIKVDEKDALATDVQSKSSKEKESGYDNGRSENSEATSSKVHNSIKENVNDNNEASVDKNYHNSRQEEDRVQENVVSKEGHKNTKYVKGNQVQDTKLERNQNDEKELSTSDLKEFKESEKNELNKHQSNDKDSTNVKSFTKEGKQSASSEQYQEVNGKLIFTEREKLRLKAGAEKEKEAERVNEAQANNKNENDDKTKLEFKAGPNEEKESVNESQNKKFENDVKQDKLPLKVNREEEKESEKGNETNKESEEKGKYAVPEEKQQEPVKVEEKENRQSYYPKKKKQLHEKFSNEESKPLDQSSVVVVAKQFDEKASKSENQKDLEVEKLSGKGSRSQNEQSDDTKDAEVTSSTASVSEKLESRPEKNEKELENKLKTVKYDKNEKASSENEKSPLSSVQDDGNIKGKENKEIEKGVANQDFTDLKSKNEKGKKGVEEKMEEKLEEKNIEKNEEKKFEQNNEKIEKKLSDKEAESTEKYSEKISLGKWHKNTPKMEKNADELERKEAEKYDKNTLEKSEQITKGEKSVSEEHRHEEKELLLNDNPVSDNELVGNPKSNKKLHEKPEKQTETEISPKLMVSKEDETQKQTDTRKPTEERKFEKKKTKEFKENVEEQASVDQEVAKEKPKSSRHKDAEKLAEFTQNDNTEKKRGDDDDRKVHDSKTAKINADMTDEELEQNSRVVLSQLKQLQSLAQSPNPDPKKIDVSALHPGTVKILKKLGEEHERRGLVDDYGGDKDIEGHSISRESSTHHETIVKYTGKSQKADIRQLCGGCLPTVSMPTEAEINQMLCEGMAGCGDGCFGGPWHGCAPPLPPPPPPPPPPSSPPLKYKLIPICDHSGFGGNCNSPPPPPPPPPPPSECKELNGGGGGCRGVKISISCDDTSGGMGCGGVTPIHPKIPGMTWKLVPDTSGCGVSSFSQGCGRNRANSDSNDDNDVNKKVEPMIPLSCLEALKGLNLPSKDGGSGGEAKCSKMLSRLLSNQAENTANTMKILASLLKDDGCSLDAQEQQVAAKMMGKLMSGGCCGSNGCGNMNSEKPCPDEGYEKFISLGPEHCSSKHASAKKMSYKLCKKPCEEVSDDTDSKLKEDSNKYKSVEALHHHHHNNKKISLAASRTVHPKFKSKVKNEKSLKKHKKSDVPFLDDADERTRLSVPENGLRRSMWTNLPTKDIAGLTSLKSYPKYPAASYVIDQFATPHDEGLQYGQRVYGYLIPPESGNYIFGTSCSDECKLLLSKNDEEDKKDIIIKHEPGSAQDQSSDAIPLKGGHTYFIEALSYHGDEASPMKVGVRLPSGTILAPIPMQYLRLERAALVDEDFDELSSPTLQSLFTQRSFPDKPSKWTPLSDFSMVAKETNGFHGHKISGYFLAKETGKYKFFGTCPNGCRLYLSEDDTCNKKSMVLEYRLSIKGLTHKKTLISLDGKTGKRTSDASLFEVSKTTELQAGLYYYIEALQATKGGEQSRLKIGVVSPSGKTSFPMKKDSLTQFSPSKHGIVREVWKNVKGDDLENFTMLQSFPRIPTEVSLMSSFESPSNEIKNYGQRLKGYFVAPMTGDYKFVISCDKNCELWMNPIDDVSSNVNQKKRILAQTNKTAIHEYDKYPDEQVSAPIHMNIGQQYYIEALHKASSGPDHLSVGVTLPSGKKEWPISKKYLRFRPRDHVSSPTDIPCNYNLEENDSSKKESGELVKTANDIAILGGETDALAQNLDFLNAPKNEEFDYDGSDNKAKVKITHLTVPFGNPNSKNAKDALSVIKNVTQNKQTQLKLHKNEDGGFTISGLPSHLNHADATKLAKGIASVLKPDGSQLMQNETKVLKPTGSKIKAINNPSVNVLPSGSATNLPKVSELQNAESTLNAENKLLNTPTEGNKTGAEIGEAKLNDQSADSINNPNTLSTNLLESTSYTSSIEPDIESLSVVGNLANMDDLSSDENNLLKQAKIQQQMESQPFLQDSFVQPIVDQSKIVQPLIDQSKVVQPVVDQSKMFPAQKIKKITSVNNGDSIGENISDMDENSDLGLELELPASTGTNIGSNTVINGINAIMNSKTPDYHNSDGIGHPTNVVANLKEPKIGVSLSPTITDEMSINKLNDYDVLNIDLEGLRRMGKQKRLMDKSEQTLKQPVQLLQAALIDANIIGDQFNEEVENLNNYSSLKKKKIPNGSSNEINSINGVSSESNDYVKRKIIAYVNKNENSSLTGSTQKLTSNKVGRINSTTTAVNKKNNA